MAKKESKGKPDKRSHVPTPTPAPVGEAEDVSWDDDVMAPPPPQSSTAITASQLLPIPWAAVED